MDDVVKLIVYPIIVAGILGYFGCAFLRPRFYLASQMPIVGVIIGLFCVLMSFNLGVLMSASRFQASMIGDKVHPLLEKQATDEAANMLKLSELGVDAINAGRIPDWAFLSLGALFVACFIFRMVADWHISEHEPRQE